MGRRLTEKTGVPITAGITGEVEALKAMGLHSLVVATPHEDDLNARMKAFLEASGFEVLQIEGYGVRKNSAISDLPVHASLQDRQAPLREGLPKRTASSSPAPRWPTIEDVELLEQEIGKPVVTSCQAYIWYALHLIRIKEAVTGYGSLMGSLAA